MMHMEKTAKTHHDLYSSLKFGHAKFEDIAAILSFISGL